MEIHEITKHATKHISFRSNPEIERKVNCFLAAGGDNADANILKSDASSTSVVQRQKAINENANILKSDVQRHFSHRGKRRSSSGVKQNGKGLRPL